MDSTNAGTSQLKREQLLTDENLQQKLYLEVYSRAVMVHSSSSTALTPNAQYAHWATFFQMGLLPAPVLNL